MKQQKIAVLGGTFDPIHNGHVRLALAFAERLQLDAVLLMPSFVPPHKVKTDLAPAEDRLAMCRLAAQPYPVLQVSDLEIRRGGASFTADTLAQLQQVYPQAQLYLLMGADMFLTVGTWNRFEQIARTAVLCAAPRDDVTVEQLRAYAAELEERGAVCVIEPVPLYAASSTALRAEPALAESLTPPAVAAYIKEKGLYRRRHGMDPEEQYKQILSGRLGKQRYAHSLAVAEQAQKLAGRLGADPAKARLAGLMHDILKDTPAETLLQMLGDFGILIEPAERETPQLLHAKAGAAFLERILGFDDPDVLNAVRYHTTGRAGMSPLETAVFLADFTSEDRQYPDVDVMRRLVLTDTDEALRYALAYTLRDLADKRRVIHPDTLALYNEVIIRQRQADREREQHGQ
ncbi:MAG: nicotinate (nicotinamide) nucleotide adenylyltransferase [Clostridia bacterium]|nr:nicotinate (nicotinamide) nucleotide adenylyltransferase [Clostridia bacterium]